MWGKQTTLLLITITLFNFCWLLIICLNFNLTHVTSAESKLTWPVQKLKLTSPAVWEVPTTFCSNELLQKVVLFTVVCSSCAIHDRKKALTTVNNNVETIVFRASCIKIIILNKKMWKRLNFLKIRRNVYFFVKKLSKITLQI